jgi:adenylosuccinate synthase
MLTLLSERNHFRLVTTGTGHRTGLRPRRCRSLDLFLLKRGMSLRTSFGSSTCYLPLHVLTTLALAVRVDPCTHRYPPTSATATCPTKRERSDACCDIVRRAMFYWFSEEHGVLIFAAMLGLYRR